MQQLVKIAALATFGLLLHVSNGNAQVGIGTTTPNASAQLEVQSTNKGVLFPRVTQANRPASPVAGLMVYQTDNTPGFYYYDGSAWVRLLSSADAVPSATSTSGFAARNSPAFVETNALGSYVSLPDNQNLSADISVNGSSTLFTLTKAGRYNISYMLSVSDPAVTTTSPNTLPLELGTRLVLNGSEVGGSISGGVPFNVNIPLVLTLAVPLKYYYGNVIINASAGDVIGLQLFNRVLNGNIQRASMTIVKVN
jgi:hypothetical protein